MFEIMRVDGKGEVLTAPLKSPLSEASFFSKRRDRRRREAVSAGNRLLRYWESIWLGWSKALCCKHGVGDASF